MTGTETAVGGVLCLGEMLLRLSPPAPSVLFQEARLDAHFGGAEANVAIGLARLGHASAMASVVPDDMVGRAAVAALRRHGVEVSGVAYRSGRLGLYYLATGGGHRASRIVYDRAGSVFAGATAEDFDWLRLLAGREWLHLSGITPAIGARSAALALAAARAARAAGVKVSFDGNFRASMWAMWNPDPAPLLAELVGQADLLFGNHRDIALMTGLAVDGDDRRAAALAGFAAFPNLRWIASTVRTVLHADHHALSARIDRVDGVDETGTVEVMGIVDRIGTGDAFAAGVIAGLAEGEARALEQGFALLVLKHHVPGDASLAGPEDVAAFLSQERDVQR